MQDNIKGPVIVTGWKLHSAVTESNVNTRVYQPEDFYGFLEQIEAPNPESIINQINIAGKDVFITDQYGWCITLCSKLGVQSLWESKKITEADEMTEFKRSCRDLALETINIPEFKQRGHNNPYLLMRLLFGIADIVDTDFKLPSYHPAKEAAGKILNIGVNYFTGD